MSVIQRAVGTVRHLVLVQIIRIEHLALLRHALGLVRGVLSEGVVAADLRVERSREEFAAEPVSRRVDCLAVAVVRFVPGVLGVGSGFGVFGGAGRSVFCLRGGAGRESGRCSSGCCCGGTGCGGGGRHARGDVGRRDDVGLVVAVRGRDDDVELLAVLALVCCHGAINVGSPQGALEAGH